MLKLAPCLESQEPAAHCDEWFVMPIEEKAARLKVYPKGLMIGKIRKIKKKSYGLFQQAEIIPSVNFAKLEEVFVITENHPIDVP